MSAPSPSTRRPFLQRLEALAPRGMKLGLAAIDAVCERLGRPERQVASVLVAGTNGKGSTAATLASIGSAAGVATGLYTSPHLIDVTERVRVGDDDVSLDELEAALGEVFSAADSAPEVPLTYFEAMTAAAFVCFGRRRLDLAVLEVGLGGRFDATNVAPASVSVVTSISIDHVDELGPSIGAIAAEKAGIFRAGRPALVESPLAEARSAFRAAAARAGAALHEMAVETKIEPEAPRLTETRFRLTTPMREYALRTPLAGTHQASNAATAVRAAELLWPALDADAVARGVESVRWPGRLERFSVGGKRLFLDGCHNPDGAVALARFIVQTGIVADLIFGAMADKDIETMAGVLAPVVRRIRLVPASSPRSATPRELARRFAHRRSDAVPAASLAAALEELLTGFAAETIIVAGSLYLIGEARALLLSGRFDERP